MKKTIIVKLGGSVITRKSSLKPYVRKKLLGKIATSLKKALHNEAVQIILIHGAGSIGHQIAHAYNLSEGVNNDKKKLQGSLEIRLKNQILNARIFSTFLEHSLSVIPIHTGSAIISNTKSISSINYPLIDLSLKNNLIPILYGEMVFDTTLGMSVCSGDAIAAQLATYYQAERVVFASDVDGIYSKDPYYHADAKIIPSASIKELLSPENTSLSGSHSIDVTGGIRNKILSFQKFSSPFIKDIIIFNGLHSENFEKIFHKTPPGTKILFS
ncbi:MAG: hypothetical protein IPN70_05250 [Candidatus Moraniibacteriota bacterium]|nr:MAG: hypothetical protein IPN70_05250 [Candidatus Moranbacteria bacterium]